MSDVDLSTMTENELLAIELAGRRRLLEHVERRCEERERRPAGKLVAKAHAADDFWRGIDRLLHDGTEEVLAKVSNDEVEQANEELDRAALDDALEGWPAGQLERREES